MVQPTTVTQGVLIADHTKVDAGSAGLRGGDKDKLLDQPPNKEVLYCFPLAWRDIAKSVPVILDDTSMASTPLYPDAQGGVDALLRTGSRVKDYAVKVTEKYAAGPESSLDGKIHLSLQPPTQLVAVISSETPAVVNRPKLSAETKESNAYVPSETNLLSAILTCCSLRDEVRQPNRAQRRRRSSSNRR